MTSRMILACASLALCLTNTAVQAADPPDAGAVQRLEREQLQRQLQERQLLKAPVAPEVALPEPSAESAASQVRNIDVTGFQVDPSAILSMEEIHAVLAPYEGRTLSLADLFDAVASLNRLYDDKAMPTARAILPPQEIQGGIVHIRLVEARLGEFKLDGLHQVTPEFVQDRLTLSSGDLMSVSRLEADLVRFNRLHDVQLRASVKPGAAVGTTDVQLDAVEPSRLQVSVFADNAGRYTVGERRLGLNARVAGLTGHSDNLMFSAVKSPGSDSYYLGYSLPVTRHDLRLDAAYSYGSIKVINGAFSPLDIGGRSREFSVGLTQPLVVDAQRLWNVYGRLVRKEMVSDFGGVSQPAIRLAVLSLGVSGEHQNETSAWTVDVNLNEGLRHLGGDTHFFALRGNAAWLGRFGARTQLVVRGGLQYSPTELLPSAEQFQLGGSASIRGYSEGLLSGRSGYLTSAELRYALQADVTPTDNRPLFTGFLFLDHGGAFPFRPGQDDVTGKDFLTGAGFGVAADWKARLSARLSLGWALKDNPAEEQQREPRLHATVSYNWP